MHTRRSFFTQLLAATGLLAVSNKLFGLTVEKPELPKPSDHLPRIAKPEIRDPGHHHILTEANSNIREVWNHPGIRMVDLDDMSQMGWLASASGRPQGAAPWKNERIVPRGWKLKKVAKFPDPESWSGGPV